MSGTVASTLLGIAAFVAAALMTGRLRMYALRGSLIDQPNCRSAHDKPTPRGGGVCIVTAFLVALIALAAAGTVELPHAIAIGGAGLIVGFVGFIDDHGHVPARWRLLTHFAAAIWLLAWLGALPLYQVFAEWGPPRPIVYVTVAVLVVWLTNLFNFMDGIDGIASVEAITVMFGAMIMAGFAGHSELAPLQLALAASVAGFLVWNWPPASIFMGDVGSGFLGTAVAGFILVDVNSPATLSAWLILLGVFLVDSGYTLLRRAIRGEILYEAHRTHAYQHAARRFQSHATVTIAVAMINLLWLLPIAIAAVVGAIPAVQALLIAYFPLIAIAWRFNAGDYCGRGAVHQITGGTPPR